MADTKGGIQSANLDTNNKDQSTVAGYHDFLNELDFAV